MAILRGVILKIVPRFSDSQYPAVNDFVLAGLQGLYYHIHHRIFYIDSFELVRSKISVSK
jgi:hypothetical protein